MRVLIVEDDPAIAGPLVRGLTRAGYDAEHVSTAAEALAATSVDLVLLDLGLPDADGIDVCRELRAGSNVPIIVISARTDELDRVLGLELGADDYVVKPFGMRELIARIRAVLRRVQLPVPVTPDSPRTQTWDTTVVGPLRLDRRARRVHLDEGRSPSHPRSSTCSRC
jgi:two-component system, OmpR family, response regulator RegX3